MNHRSPYALLALMFALHAVLMYVLMYAMVNVPGNVFHSYNQAYMAVLMASPMLVIELLLMRAMYPSSVMNAGVAALGIVLLTGSFLLIRSQAAVADEQFLRSMIPHHAGAILMCEEAELADPQVKELCANIVAGQQAEIDWMKAKLESL